MSAAADRIDILDEAGRSIGWVDPRSGARNLSDPGHAKEFDEMVDFWMTTAGVDGPDEASTRPHRPDVGHRGPLPRPARNSQPADPVAPPRLTPFGKIGA